MFLLNGRQEVSWHVARHDHWRWHGVESIEHSRLEEVVFTGETPDGQIAAVLNPEGRGVGLCAPFAPQAGVGFQTHPHWEGRYG